MKHGNVARNVARLVDRVAGNRQKLRTLTDKQMSAILDHDSRDRHLWTLAMYGRRRGEIAGLRWYNVDLKAKTVVIVENRVANGKQILTGTPKSKASNRMLPMPEEVVAILKARACDSRGAAGIRRAIRVWRVRRVRRGRSAVSP